jgi:hypothetical protein
VLLEPKIDLTEHSLLQNLNKLETLTKKQIQTREVNLKDIMENTIKTLNGQILAIELSASQENTVLLFKSKIGIYFQGMRSLLKRLTSFHTGEYDSSMENIKIKLDSIILKQVHFSLALAYYSTL